MYLTKEERENFDVALSKFMKYSTYCDESFYERGANWRRDKVTIYRAHWTENYKFIFFKVGLIKELQIRIIGELPMTDKVLCDVANSSFDAEKKAEDKQKRTDFEQLLAYLNKMNRRIKNEK